ncbi:anaerobic ribonucleoside-triphosphate reductase [Terrilactibacillus sp. BCM23-1]|uniref:Anaerobic ribonucleoside-triphosphate reductase n=1 Tax=Terrilactibacillus tamarindi TaxID=2599694 RepID=A0A6N8CS93_9BACI|nr:anaerobic ribonucleoside-triphosphate reductase [Terrilactibacillus tamarindi]MTT31933.1 anaerobic ribonucleoside-triphosphate reductase [Terrilactibacillus tamarindi]
MVEAFVNKTLDEKIRDLIILDESIANENANKDGNVFNTQRDLLAGITAKDYSMRYLLPKRVAESHERGEIHFHDLDYSPFFPMFNCMLIDFKGMFENGFSIGHADIEEPKSIKTAAALVAQIVANVSSNIYGGTTFNRADEVLEPYAIRSFKKHLRNGMVWIPGEKEQEDYAYKMTEKEIYDAMQSLEYEINTLFSSNGQTPFFSFNFGLGTSWFAREIQKAILKVRIEGLGRDKKTAVFPKLIFTLKRGINLDSSDPNYDIKKLALECSAKRMYPDILSYDKIVEMTGDFKSPMGCRSFLSSYQENGKYITDGRNNLGVCTLNLPRIAIESNGDRAVFWSLLYERLDIVYEALMFRIESLHRTLAKNAPILYQYGATGNRLHADEHVVDMFKNGRATISIGYIGLYEVATVFYGAEWEGNKDAKTFTIDIMKALKDTADGWKRETGYGFSVYATPSESLTDRFCRLDTQSFGEIKDITDKGYYTNSFHYDTRKKVNPFEKIDFEKEYEPYTTGGFIHYCEFPSLVHNLEGLEVVWDYAYDRIGYFGTNTPIDKCYECGFEGEFESTTHGFECPNCHNDNPETTSCIRRLCGYLGSVIQRKPIKGRLKEINSRTKHV